MVVKNRATPPNWNEDMKNNSQSQTARATRDHERSGHCQSKMNGGSGADSQNRKQSEAGLERGTMSHGGDLCWVRATNFWF
jgi:hypothetical protein